MVCPPHVENALPITTLPLTLFATLAFGAFAAPVRAAIRLDLDYVDKHSDAYAAFKNYVDDALEHPAKPPYGFSATDAVYMARLDGKPAYCALAIDLVQQQVDAANAATAAGKTPAVAGDSYLQVGPMVGDLALTYEVCAAKLTTDARAAWVAYAERAIANVWDHAHASWGGRAAPWTGWSTSDPGDNYYYSFLSATMLWALASDSARWKALLETDKLPALQRYMATLPGGGSLEGTGYGVAHMRLFTLYRLWRDATGEDLAAANTHLTDSIDYWIHATVPSADAYAPFGDHSRSSQPLLYDYHRILMLEARALTTSAGAKAEASGWLNAISIKKMTSSFNTRFDLLPAGRGGTAPPELWYQARGVGEVFARTSWDRDATWMSFIAGRYEQSHAHQEQGAFSLYRGRWLAVTENIWTHSGIQQGSETNNVLRFTRGGHTIGQVRPSVSSLAINATGAGGELHASANLSAAYAKNSGVHAWQRDIDFVGGTLSVRDRYDVAADITTVFQINVPARPVVEGNHVRADNLDIVVQTPADATIRVVDWRALDADFLSGWRIDIEGRGGAFDVRLGAADGKQHVRDVKK